jgi:flotillin
MFSFLLPLLVLALILLVGGWAVVAVVNNLLYVCQPNEVLVFSGRARTAGDRQVGYRIIKGGRTLRVPLLEVVDRLDLTNMIIEVSVRGAYSKGGIPLTVHGVANIKLPGDEPLIHNALERHLGKSRQEIMQTARETLEGNLRGVLALLTPEQVNEDKETFAAKLAEEAEHDLSKIGLYLDTLKIQNVSDDVGYLDAIGRMRSAEIRRNAQVSEAEAQASSAEVKWRNQMQGKLSQLETQIEIARRQNDRRIADARTKREALIAEQQAAVQAAIAQAKAEMEMQTARIEQTRLRLQADVVRPAEAAMKRAASEAKAKAAATIEQGRATADVLRQIAAAYGGGNGKDVLLMSKLVPVLQQLSGTIGDLHVDRLTVLGRDGAGLNGHGAGNGAPGDDLTARVVRTAEQLRAATGVDLTAVARDWASRQRAATSREVGGPAVSVPPPPPRSPSRG